MCGRSLHSNTWQVRDQNKEILIGDVLTHYLLSGYDQTYTMTSADGHSSPVRHTTYASQVNYYLQQSQQQQLQQQQAQAQQQQAQAGPQQAALQSGGPRTTPSGYPGGPVVPSGTLSSPTNTTSVAGGSSHVTPGLVGVGYTTTGRPSTHQQQPMSFTRYVNFFVWVVSQIF